MKHRLSCAVLVGVVWTCGSNFRPVDGGTSRAAELATDPKPRLPAEFEQQQAILVGWSGDAATDRTLVDVIFAAGSKTRFVVLVPSEEERADAADLLRRAGVAAGRVQFLQLPFDTVWIRDYGPLVVEAGDGTARILDPTYPCPDRIQDDCIPVALSLALGLPLTEVPLDLDGGNLLSNGAGLCITTQELVQQNVHRGYNQQAVGELLARHFGFEEVVFLEPLVDEPTGHVDMFATFTSADTVVVGQMDRELDEWNADILDRNAERLRRVVTPYGPLKVVRIPMPAAEDGTWRTYTNVLYANGRLVLPVYPGVDAEGHAGAVRVYQRLLPQWQVVGVDCRELIQQGGAIHCVTLNSCRLPKLRQPAMPFEFVPFPDDGPLNGLRIRATAKSNAPKEPPFASSSNGWRFRVESSAVRRSIRWRTSPSLIP